MATNKTVNVEKSTEIAADELIAVTGDKSIDRLWDLADSIVKASPNLLRNDLFQIRRAAVAKAGHEEFWSVQRLRQLGKTAQAWDKKNRIPDVSLDAHMEAYRHGGADITAAGKLIADAAKLAVKKGKKTPSIRDVRAAAGANGTKAQPPRIDKAEPRERWAYLQKDRRELEKWLRQNLGTEAGRIETFAKMFADLHAKAQAATGKKTSAPAAPVKKQPVARKPRAEKKGRVKGL